MMFKLVLLAALLASVLSSDGEWSYDGVTGPPPDEWYENYPMCAGNHQSPIDITGAVYDGNLGPFVLENFDVPISGGEWILENNGHSAQMNLQDATYMASGGGLPSVYGAVQFHFHWGTNDNVGSEHHVNGDSFPLEMHIVHYDISYESITDALEQENGLAVMGVFFEISDEDNENLQPLIEALSGIHEDSESEGFTPIAITDLMPTTLDAYYRYYGSLTTPGCNEVVVWTLFRDPVPISESQMEAFRSISLHSGPENFRPIQPLNDREITASFGN